MLGSLLQGLYFYAFLQKAVGYGACRRTETFDKISLPCGATRYLRRDEQCSSARQERLFPIIRVKRPSFRGRPIEELSKSSIWLTTPMQQRSKSRFICDWLSATAGRPYESVFYAFLQKAVGYGACRRTETFDKISLPCGATRYLRRDEQCSSARQERLFPIIRVKRPSFRGRPIEELSKSSIWLTTPMQQRSKSRFICDWLSATAGRPYESVFYASRGKWIKANGSTLRPNRQVDLPTSPVYGFCNPNRRFGQNLTLEKGGFI